MHARGSVLQLCAQRLTTISVALVASIGCHAFVSGARLEGTAGAGFAGLHVDEQLESPLLLPCKTPCAQTASDTSVLLRTNSRFTWKPAISTGLALHVPVSATSLFAWGIGGHMVFIPNSEGQTTPFPAATVHFGDGRGEVFFGAIFLRDDLVQFPNGLDTVTVRKTASVAAPNFVLRNAGTRRLSNFYAGLQLNGSRQSESDALTAARKLPENVKDVKLVPETIAARVGDSKQILFVLVDAGGSPVAAAVRPTWTSQQPDVATVSATGIVSAKSKGAANIIIQVGDIVKVVPVTVTD
jgi:Bacterial surface proteins containing Ig-like domains